MRVCVGVWTVLHNSPRCDGILINSRHSSEWSQTEGTSSSSPHTRSWILCNVHPSEMLCSAATLYIHVHPCLFCCGLLTVELSLLLCCYATKENSSNIAQNLLFFSLCAHRAVRKSIPASIRTAFHGALKNMHSFPL